MLCCGFVPTNHPDIMANLEQARPIQTPALHVQGRTDPVIPNDFSDGMREYFAPDKVELCKHPGGHHQPYNTTHVNQIASFLLKHIPPSIYNPPFNGAFPRRHECDELPKGEGAVRGRWVTQCKGSVPCVLGSSGLQFCGAGTARQTRAAASHRVAVPLPMSYIPIIQSPVFGTGYLWAQTKSELTITVDLDDGCGARDVSVTLRVSPAKMSIKGAVLSSSAICTPALRAASGLWMVAN